MSSYTTAALCNVALLGHAGAGKTTLAEALLHHGGVTAAGSGADNGSTVYDHDPLEKTHGHSLDITLGHFDYRGRHVNLIDTPGYPDFLGRAFCALPAVETAAVVINAQTGIEPMAQRAMDMATRRQLCRMVIVNRIDAADDLPGVLAQLQEAFGVECLPVNLPADAGTRVADCFFEPAGEADFLGVEAAHTALVDQVVEVDEALMALYLEQGEITPEQLHEPFEQALREGHLIPVCFVSARTGAGVAELLEVFARLMPTPTEGNPPPFLRGDGDGNDEELHPYPDSTAPVLAHVFKTFIDPFVGKVGLLRVAQGTLGRDQSLLIGDARKPVKLAKLYKAQGKHLAEVDTLVAGDLGAVSKLEALHHDAVLHDSHDDDLIHMPPFELPPPTYGLAIEPERRSDEKKLSEALNKLAAEDPFFHVDRDAATNETVIRGYGELHLRTMIERMHERYHVDVHTHTPKVAYRETITRPAEGHCRHKKQTGGAGQFGEVFLRVEPLARGAGFEFASEVVGGAIPTSLIPAVEKGVREAMAAGAISGHPMQDVRVVVHDGKHHSVDSKEIAFVIAGRKAFLDAARKAGPIVLEPYARLEVTAPEPSMGGVTSDLSARRGRIIDTRNLPDGIVTLSAEAPLSELGDYESTLKSLTSGQGRYAVEGGDYEPAPPGEQERIVSEFKERAHSA